MDEKRKHERKKPSIKALIYDPSGGRLIGDIEDISKNGLRLITDAALKTNTTFNLKISSLFQSVDDIEIPIKAKTVWCTKHKKKDSFQVGLQILDIEDNLTDDISKYFL